MNELQANTTTIARVLCIDSKKAWRWYRDILSGFSGPKNQEKSKEHDLTVYEKGERKTIRVPILRVENIGENMAIDEKQIGEEMHTVISNRDTGKIALLARTLKASHLSELLPFFKQKGYKVRTITRDLSNTYDWFSRQAFMNAVHIADKFHIIKHLLDSQQAIRIRYRQEILRDKRIKYEAYKKKEREREKRYIQAGKTFKKIKFSYKQKRLENRETRLEILSRSRYLLYKYKSDWKDSQRARANILFAEYPELESAYKLSLKFRTWYKKTNVGKDINLIKKQLKEWYSKVDEVDIDEMSNFKSLVERHEPEILAYFRNGYTNAIAECINSKIQRFIAINQGTRDREFFYFRINNFFSAPQNEI